MTIGTVSIWGLAALIAAVYHCQRLIFFFADQCLYEVCIGHGILVRTDTPNVVHASLQKQYTANLNR